MQIEKNLEEISLAIENEVLKVELADLQRQLAAASLKIQHQGQLPPQQTMKTPQPPQSPQPPQPPQSSHPPQPPQSSTKNEASKMSPEKNKC
ncbi:uncharacterized protein LOC112639444 [Camponotus floridanus]|uniref:uncharacterized protein LOC112639444 n=1 Tax=Camponotus floridanus TaxID=104421 RepID=UPI000DC6C7C9|nr:uncharacterized protein LOC112639444 [Camponotus floridanus]